MLEEIVQLFLYVCVFFGGYYLGSRRVIKRGPSDEVSLEHVESDRPESEDVEEKPKRQYARYGFFN